MPLLVFLIEAPLEGEGEALGAMPIARGARAEEGGGWLMCWPPSRPVTVSDSALCNDASTYSSHE